jgi:phospholipase/lecithinase/hemolysin
LLSCSSRCSCRSHLPRADAVTRLVVFRDSLSDPGNHFIAFGTSARQPYEPAPEASYAVGGHHFSNGATWAERLAADLGGPALSVPGLFTNYAVGRARARAGAPAFPDHDLRTQIGQFLTDFRGQAPSGDLYVVWIGANDVSDALSALAIDPSLRTAATQLSAAYNGALEQALRRPTDPADDHSDPPRRQRPLGTGAGKPG